MTREPLTLAQLQELWRAPCCRCRDALEETIPGVWLCKLCLTRYLAQLVERQGQQRP